MTDIPDDCAAGLYIKMIVMYVFCKYFSVRLGSIIVSFCAMLQSFVGVILFSIWLSQAQQTEEQISRWLSNNNLIFMTGFFRDVEQSTEAYMKGFLVFFTVHFLTCLLLGYGAYKCNRLLMYPFLITESVRLLSLSYIHVVGMMIMKENILDLGLLIGCSLAGGFMLLLLFYMWFCVISLCGCIQVLQQKKSQPLYHKNNISTEFQKLYKSYNVYYGNLATPAF